MPGKGTSTSERIFFSTRRGPFFFKAARNFNIGGTGSGAALQSLFHTRTIVNPLLGVKLSGKVASNHTISTLLANDELRGSGASKDAWFGFARYKLSLSEDSYVGAAYADREFGSAYNRVARADGLIRVGSSSQFDFHGFASFAKDSSSGGLLSGYAAKAQLSSSDRDIQYEILFTDLSDDFRADMGFLNRIGITRVSRYIKPWF